VGNTGLSEFFGKSNIAKVIPHEITHSIRNRGHTGVNVHGDIIITERGEETTLRLRFGI
jgi:hypothetical protein